MLPLRNCFKRNVLKVVEKSETLILSLSIYLPILSYSAHSIRGAVAGGAGLQYATQWSMSIKEFLTISISIVYLV